MANCLTFVEESVENKETKCIELYLKSIEILENILSKKIMIPQNLITKEPKDLEEKDLTRTHL